MSRPVTAAAGDDVPGDELRACTRSSGSSRSGSEIEGGQLAALDAISRSRSNACRNLSVHAGETGIVALVDCVPVDGVPPGLEILGTAVLVLEVVGVLPDVVAEYREARGLDDPGHQGVV